MRVRSLVAVWSVVLVSAGLLAACGGESGESGISGRALAAKQGSPGVPAGEKGVKGGVVAVSHPLAAQAGADVLRAGGNAIDAAAAVQFALNVVEPQFSGIGGGGFMMIHLAKEDRTIVVDSRERAPAAATPTMFEGMSFGLASTSGISVGVPGTLMGVATALRRWGTFSLDKVLARAIELAQDGFPVGPTLARDSTSSRLDNYAEARAVFKPNGAPLAEGSTLRQPDLAKTFRLIAERGIDVFYRGEIANAIVQAQTQTRAELPSGTGRMALSDLLGYQIEIRKPTVGTYRGYKIKSMSPPSSGGLTVVQMLKMVEQFPLGDVAQGFGFGATKTLHVMLEAMRLAYADRAVWMGDSDFVLVPETGLIADPYLATRAALIQPNSRIATVVPGDPRPYDPRYATSGAVPTAEASEEGVHTTHFSIVDRWGNVVSYTTTIEAGWGSGILVPGYGFLLNNELTDFNFTPTANPDPANFNPGANDVAPFKRPRSSMAPTILFDKKQPIAAYGSPGGATIINSVFNITMNLIDHGMSIQEAIDAPRISRTSTSDSASASYEAGFASDALQGVRDLGHALSGPTSIGSVQAIVIDAKNGKFYGGADKRREGTVIALERNEVK